MLSLIVLPIIEIQMLLAAQYLEWTEVAVVVGVALDELSCAVEHLGE